MVENEFKKLKDQLVEQKITQQKTITAGSTETIAITIPRDKKVFLKGYGYSWFSTNEFTLSTGNRQFPTGSDQQGSPSIPMIFGNPFPCRAGGKLQITIKNGDIADHTYDVVFYILTNDHLDITSTGSELILATGSGSSTGNSVAIWDSAFSASAPVDATLGIAVNPVSRGTLLAGTKATTSASAVAIATSTGCRKVTVQADVNNTEEIYIGNATAQPIVLGIGQSIDLEVNNLNLIYIKRMASANQTVNYIGA